MCDVKIIAEHINCLGGMLGLISSGLNEEIITVREVNKWINENVIGFNENCVLLDKLLSEIKLRHTNINKDELKKNIKVKFTKSEFDGMGFFYSMFSLNTKFLEDHSKVVLFDGECLEVNINNYYGCEEQLFLGTCCF